MGLVTQEMVTCYRLLLRYTPKSGQFVSAEVLRETVSKCVTVVKILTSVSSLLLNFSVVADKYVFFTACGGKNSV